MCAGPRRAAPASGRADLIITPHPAATVLTISGTSPQKKSFGRDYSYPKILRIAWRDSVAAMSSILFIAGLSF